MFWKNRHPANTAKILNRGECLVTMAEKSVILGLEWATEEEPWFEVFVGPNSQWKSPAGEIISTEEIDEIKKFVPAELLRRDGVAATVEVIIDD